MTLGDVRSLTEQPSIRRSRRILAPLIVVLCLAGGGFAVWYGTVYAPARQADAMRALLADIGAPQGFGPDGAPIENTVGNGLNDISQTYVMHCPGGVCPVSAEASVVAWALRAGSPDLTNDYVSKFCVQAPCETSFGRDGFSVRLLLTQGRYPPAADTPNVLYEVIVTIQR